MAHDWKELILVLSYEPLLIAVILLFFCEFTRRTSQVRVASQVRVTSQVRVRSPIILSVFFFSITLMT